MFGSRSILALFAASSLTVASVACSGGGDTIVTTAGPSEGISVSGEGRVSATPDIATVRLGVRVEAPTVEEAREQAAQLQTAILNSVKDNGVESKDLQTSNFSIQPLYTADPARAIRGYSVTNTLALKVRKLADVSKILDDATKAGSNNITVQGLTFGIDDPEEIKAEARKLAMEQAKKRAQETADNAGVDLGKPISISEGYSGGVYDAAVPMAAGAASRAADTPSPIESGSLDIVVNVQVLYRID
jgi:uncharacterized protein YggE